MSSSGFSARASLYRDPRVSSRSRDSPVPGPPPAPPAGPPDLATAFSDFGLGVGVSASRDPGVTARSFAALPGGDTGGEFVSVPSVRSFGDQFLAETNADATAIRESFSLDGLTETDLMTATLTAESRSQSAVTAADVASVNAASRRNWVKADPRVLKPASLDTHETGARDTSQFVDYDAPSAGSRVKFQGDAKSSTTNGEPTTSVTNDLQNSVSLVVLDVSNESVCGAVVGVAGKFCIQPFGRCSTKSHRKAVSFTGGLRDQGLQQCLFIRVPTPKTGSASSATQLAFQDPFLDATKLPKSKLQEMTQALKPVWLWSSMFAMLSGDTQGQDTTLMKPGPATPLKHKTLEEIQQDATFTAFTPAKRLELEAVEVPSPIEESELEDLGQDLDDTTFKQKVTQNTVATAHIHRATAAELAAMRIRQGEQNQLINVLVDKVNVLSGLLGAPPDDSEATTVWQAIGEWRQAQEEKKISPALLQAIHETQALHGESFKRMYASIDALQSRMHSLKNEAMHSSRKEFVALITEQVNKAIWAELSKTSPTLKIAEKFFLKGGLTDFEHHIRNTTAAAVQAAGSTGGQTSMFNLTQDEVVEVRKLVSKLEEEFQNNRVRIQDLEARTESQTVEVEGFKFTSLSHVAAFVSSNSVTTEALKFVDAMALMEMCTTGSQSFSENVDVHYRGQRSNMERASDQKAVYSFQLVAPTALAGTPDQARASPRKLSKVETYEKFKGSGSRDSGTANAIRKMISDKYPALMSEIETSSMSRDAKVIARYLLSDAKSFLDTLFIYMKDQVEDYGSDTNLSETRRWDLVQNITRIVFKVISLPRRACSEITINQATSRERAPDLLWATLQAHRLQKEFVEHQFKNHPKVGPMLTHFLLDVVSFHDDVNPIVDDVKKALSDAQQAKRKVDAVESQVKNIQARLPSKKAKNNNNTKEE